MGRLGVYKQCIESETGANKDNGRHPEILPAPFEKDFHHVQLLSQLQTTESISSIPQKKRVDSKD
jgi:hypothetical protein